MQRMERQFFDDSIEAVLSEHEGNIVSNNQVPVYHIHTLDGLTTSGRITKLSPSLVVVCRGEGNMEQRRFIRRELIVSAELTYKITPNRNSY